MPRTFISIWVHAIWSTKNREKLLSSSFRKSLFFHIKRMAEEKGYYIDSINGMDDHVHCLISLKSTQTFAKAIKDIKGESSRWINESQLIEGEFSWQEGYAAFSVSNSHLNKVRAYILNQEKHHREKSYIKEMEEIAEKLNEELDK